MERAIYKPLPMAGINEGVTYHPAGTSVPKPVKVDSPAIEVMTDLRKIEAATIEKSAILAQANKAMIARGVRLLLVVGENRHIEGLITARDTMGEKPITLIRERGGKHAELTVAELMTPRSSIETLSLDAVLHAEVGHIIATLKEVGRQHTLVIDTSSGEETVCGVFSATQIGRQLGVQILTFEVARTFAEIEAELAK